MDTNQVAMDKMNGWKKRIAYFTGSQALFMTGEMLVQYAIIWHVTLSTQSGAILGLITAFSLLPMIFVLPFTGVLADLIAYRTLLVFTNGSLAMISGFIALYLYTSSAHELSILLTVAFFRSLGQGIQNAIIPVAITKLTPKNDLLRINGIWQTLQSGMQLISPALAAVLLNRFALSSIFIVDAILAVFSLVLLGKNPIPVQTKDQRVTRLNFLKDVTVGVHYVAEHSVLKKLIIVGFIGSILVTPVANLTPLQITQKFGDTVWHLSVSEMLFSLGMIIGGGAISLWGGFNHKILTIAFSYGVLFFPFILLSLTTHFSIYACCMSVIGMIIPCSRIAMVSFVQEIVDINYLGRVMSLITMGISLASPLTMLLIGPLANVVSIDRIIFVTSFLLILLAVFSLWKLRNTIS